MMYQSHHHKSPRPITIKPSANSLYSLPPSENLCTQKILILLEASLNPSNDQEKEPNTNHTG